MKWRSKKAADRAREAKPFRDALLLRYPRCMICGSIRRNSLLGKSVLCVHEIANGPYRQKALDKPYACLVLCVYCNEFVVTDKAVWPQSRQLARLKACLADNYDLQAFNRLINPNAPNRITEDEVNAWLEQNKRRLR